MTSVFQAVTVDIELVAAVAFNWDDLHAVPHGKGILQRTYTVPRWDFQHHDIPNNRRQLLREPAVVVAGSSALSTAQ